MVVRPANCERVCLLVGPLCEINEHKLIADIVPARSQATV